MDQWLYAAAPLVLVFWFSVACLAFRVVERFFITRHIYQMMSLYPDDERSSAITEYLNNPAQTLKKFVAFGGVFSKKMKPEKSAK